MFALELLGSDLLTAVADSLGVVGAKYVGIVIGVRVSVEQSLVSE